MVSTSRRGGGGQENTVTTPNVLTGRHRRHDHGADAGGAAPSAEGAMSDRRQEMGRLVADRMLGRRI
jgi:hypothetical protein